MKFLIVNADDFGASPGINRGILEAHRRGVVTSASLLVNTSGSLEAVALSRTVPRLSVGLHVDLGKELPEGTGLRRLGEELWEQLARFEDLMSRPPTHLDSHHNLHRNPQALPLFLELAEEHGVPLREHSSVHYFSKFYGQWNGETHLEQISAENLARMLQTEVGEGFTELSCHPGYVDTDYPTGYATEREVELRTLCDPGIQQTLLKELIQLVSYHDLAQLGVSAGT
ncbi:MAG: hypothetical protein DMG06_28315 [Acidobacteria bacterium]|nr:MAG: hypothetical protein DMG06_28315 [Acidobacteriota bacterium]